MTPPNGNSWIPFRPTAQELETIESDVAEIPAIQQRLTAKCPALHLPDRVAHQYQVAGGKVLFKVASRLPADLDGVGLFQPAAEYCGIGRISTGLGTPHIETNPDFLGAMLAFQTREGHRVDFFAINDPTSPTDNHRDFVSVLHATAESAGAQIPLVGDWGEYNAGNLIAEQKEFGQALKDRMGWLKAGKTLAHIVKQTLRTFLSSTAYQTYWTGVVEAGGKAGKFTLVPTRDENRRPGFHPGDFHLSEEWRQRQCASDIEFALYWISFVNEQQTPINALTERWEEGHKQQAGAITFPRTDPDSPDATLWATLASEMGANPGNWVADKGNTIRQPATEFTMARKIAYQMSQNGRAALDPQRYAGVFASGNISPELAQELTRRRTEKEQARQVNRAWGRSGA